MNKLWRTAAIAATLIAAAGSAAPPADPGYAYYSIGDVAAPTPDRTSAALLLVGGGEWDRDAFRWFAARAGHGHVVVLRASGAAEAGEELFRDIGGLASVQTLVFASRTAAHDPRVLDILSRADGIFIAGGDQANYVRFWKGTPVARLLDAHIRKGRPIGGTSAGLAILGGTAYGAMDGGSIDSGTALRDPAGPAVTLVTGFLDMPRLRHVVTDTHFAARDRLGRLIAFVAKARQADGRAVGLGVDEDSALCVEDTGLARLCSAGPGHGWLVQADRSPRLQPGRPLDWRNVRITGIGPRSTLDLNDQRVSGAAFAGVARVENGRLLDAPAPPAGPN